MDVSFAGKLPVWANEGVAMFADGQHLQDVRTEHIRRYVRSGEWPQLRHVLDADSIRDNIESYAVADYLTKYLLTLGSASTLFSFAVEGDRIGWEAAARQWYGLPLGQLEQDWQSWVTRMVSRYDLLARRPTRRPSLNH
jgi:hypothetical protein